MTEPVWIDLEVVLAIHDEQLAEHGETRPLRAVSRPESAAPSTGSSKHHAAEQERLLSQAFTR